jgi:hypothetical protein
MLFVQSLILLLVLFRVLLSVSLLLNCYEPTLRQPPPRLRLHVA